LLPAKHDYGDSSGGQVLLIFHILVGGEKYIETGSLRCRQQLAVLDFVPALLKRGGHRMPVEIGPDRYWSCLIEKDTHPSPTFAAKAEESVFKGVNYG
jgi:hypothetical protein